MHDIAGYGEVHASRTVVFQGRPDHRANILQPVDPESGGSESGRDLLVVGVGEHGDDPGFAPVEDLLAVQGHAPALVVHHDRDDRQAVADHRVELLRVESRSAVADDQYDPPVGFGYLGAYRQARGHAEEAKVTAAHRAPGPCFWQRHHGPMAQLAAIDDDRGTGIELPEQLAERVIRMHPAADTGWVAGEGWLAAAGPGGGRGPVAPVRPAPVPHGSLRPRPPREPRGRRDPHVAG